MQVGERASGEKHAKTALLCLGNVRVGWRASHQYQYQGFTALMAQEHHLRVPLTRGKAYMKPELMCHESCGSLTPLLSP